MELDEDTIEKMVKGVVGAALPLLELVLIGWATKWIISLWKEEEEDDEEDEEEEEDED